MSGFESHPTVLKLRRMAVAPVDQFGRVIDSEWLKSLALECGADDAGIVSIDSALLDDQREEIIRSFPDAKAIISIVCKTNHHAIRAPQRSIANSEFHHTGRHVDEVGRAIASKLMESGIGAMNEPMAFPMEYADFPGSKTWIVSHKSVAVAAGMGKMGIHRNVIHPKFGNFILLGSIVIDRPVSGAQESPLDYNPCLECKLCVAACPVGAIGKEGYFNFSACMTHNYREFMGGFIDWVNVVTDSKSSDEYKTRFNDGETVSMWQSLSYGANYKAAYCIAVCPAGEDVISPFLSDAKGFVKNVVNPLQEKSETIYVVKGTDAVEHVTKRFPNKRIKFVGNGLSAKSAQSFLFATKLIFQPEKSRGMDVVYHFSFTGRESMKSTISIKNQKLTVEDGHQGKRSLLLEADSEAWVRFVNGKLNLFLALASRKIKIKGDIRLMRDFSKCFPRG